MLCSAEQGVTRGGYGSGQKSFYEDVIKRFGCRRNTPPSEPAFRRILQKIDAVTFDQAIGKWLTANLAGCAVAIDGKTVRGSDDDGIRLYLLSTVVLNQKKVDTKTNEIKMVKPLLDDLLMEGAIVTADVLLTQKEIARYIGMPIMFLPSRGIRKHSSII